MIKSSFVSVQRFFLIQRSSEAALASRARNFLIDIVPHHREQLTASNDECTRLARPRFASNVNTSG